MPPITFSNGLASGLNTQGIIDALIEVGRQPAVLLEGRIAQRTNQIAAFQGLSALLVGLQIEADRLSDPVNFERSLVTPSDEEVVTGTADGDAPSGSYTFTVNAMAQSQILASQGFASEDVSVGTGTVSVQIGSTAAETITLQAGSSSLADLRDAINASDAGVSASVLNTGSGATPFRLLLTSKETGAANQITFSSSLTGGVKPVFTSRISKPTLGAGFQGTATFTNVGPATLGTWSGLATPTAGGSYDGASSKTYTFTSQTTGAVGVTPVTFNYTDSLGGTGTIDLPASYAAGTAVEIEDGVSVSFSAGTLVSGDDFTIGVTGRGTYLGTGNKTYSFTVNTGGTIGTDEILIDYDDGQGGAGTVTVPSSYAVRSQIAVAQGVVLALDGGTLVAGDTFTIDVSTPVLQAAQDASISIGGAGGSPITVTSDTNDFDDLIDGLSLTVHKTSADPVTIDVARDVDGLKQSIANFVDRYNSVVDYLDSQLSYDAETEAKGVLFSDPTILRMDLSLRRTIVSRVAGIDGAFGSLAAIGVKTDVSGRLSIDDSALTEALTSDIASVQKLFAAVGEANDSDIQVLSVGDRTKATTTHGTADVSANGYAVNITRAAERARIVGESIADPSVTPLVIDGSNNVVQISINGVTGSQVNLTEKTYSSGDELAAEIQNKINGDSAIGANSVVVTFQDDGSGQGHFEIASDNYGEIARIQLNEVAGNAFTSGLGFTAAQMGVEDTGVDVAGTINGEEAHGSGQLLSGGPKDPDDPEDFDTLGIQLLVTITADELSTQGSDQGRVKVSAGVASLLAREMDRLSDPSEGVLKRREDGLNAQIDAFNDQIDQIDQRLALRRRSLEAQFAALESAMLDLQSQGNFLTQQLSGLPSSTGISTRG